MRTCSSLCATRASRTQGACRRSKGGISRGFSQGWPLDRLVLYILKTVPFENAEPKLSDRNPFRGDSRSCAVAELCRSADTANERRQAEPYGCRSTAERQARSHRSLAGPEAVEQGSGGRA